MGRIRSTTAPEFTRLRRGIQELKHEVARREPVQTQFIFSRDEAAAVGKFLLALRQGKDGAFVRKRSQMKLVAKVANRMPKRWGME